MERLLPDGLRTHLLSPTYFPASHTDGWLNRPIKNIIDPPLQPLNFLFLSPRPLRAKTRPAPLANSGRLWERQLLIGGYWRLAGSGAQWQWRGKF